MLFFKNDNVINHLGDCDLVCNLIQTVNHIKKKEQNAVSCQSILQSLKIAGYQSIVCG